MGKRLIGKKKQEKKKYVSISFHQSCFYCLPFGYKIPCSPSGEAFVERMNTKLVIHREVLHPKKADANQMDLRREGVKQRRRKKDQVIPRVVAPWRQDLAEDLFREVFFG